MTPNAFCSLGVLAVAATDDVLLRKVHNIILGVLALISIGVVFYFGGLPALEVSALGLLTGLAFYLPLAWIGIVGGADMKVLAVVGISTGPLGTLFIGMTALLWGVLLGFLQITLKGQLKTFFKNMVQIVRLETIEKKDLHKIPFAVALFLSGLTLWSWGRLS